MKTAAAATHALIFPALGPGEGVVFNCKITRKQEAGLQRVAAAVGVFATAGRLPSAAALLRAIGEGTVEVRRIPSAALPADPVHRGCPVEKAES